MASKGEVLFDETGTVQQVHQHSKDRVGVSVQLTGSGRSEAVTLYMDAAQHPRIGETVRIVATVVAPGDAVQAG